MTRLCIIGSSHVGAVKQAEPDIVRAYPGLQIDWFAVPGGAFRRRCKVVDGVLHAKPMNAKQAELFLTLNGDMSRDLAPYDRLWIIGDPMGVAETMRAWLDLPATKARAITEGAVRTHVGHLTGRFPKDPRITVTAAPYPARSAAEPGPNHDEGLAGMLPRPDGNAICAEYEAMLNLALIEAGYDYLPQPAATRDGPFATADRYLHGARDFRAPDSPSADLIHMNATYGLELFHHFARTCLRIAPADARP
jgi:hypothetical protein